MCKKAKEIAQDYDKLSQCYDVLKDLNTPDNSNHLMLSPYSMHGWRVRANSLERIGIDMDIIYRIIEQKVIEQKNKIERELRKLDEVSL